MVTRARMKSSPPRLSRDAERLARFARALAMSGSAVEDRFWESRISQKLGELMRGTDAAIEAALEFLHTNHPEAYSVLVDLCEIHAESSHLEGHDVLLVAAPILAWSRYAIASGDIPPAAVQSLRDRLKEIVGADGVAVAVMPFLYSIDQLPRRFSEIRALADLLGRSSRNPALLLAAPRQTQETAPLLADTRYLLAGFSVAEGEPMFRWQDASDTARERTSRNDALDAWRRAAQADLAGLLPGCVVDVSTPDGYHYACLQSEAAIRPYGIEAAIAFLRNALGVEPGELRAVVGAFGNEDAEELRIAFTRGLSVDVVHGVVWPFFGPPDAGRADLERAEVRKILQQCGVTQMVALDELFPLEFCDDCGAPLYADASAELVHPELPDDVEPNHMHLH